MVGHHSAISVMAWSWRPRRLLGKNFVVPLAVVLVRGYFYRQPCHSTKARLEVMHLCGGLPWVASQVLEVLCIVGEQTDSKPSQHAGSCADASYLMDLVVPMKQDGPHLDSVSLL